MDNGDILLKIRRQFRKDEAVKVLETEISRLNFRIGELKSQLSELADFKKDIKKEAFAEIQKDEFVNVLNNKLTEKGKIIKNLKDDVDYWRSKYLTITQQINQQNQQP